MDILSRYSQIISNRQAPLVIEFGACDGYHSNILIDRLSSISKDFDYHLFEPAQDLYSIIIKRIKHQLDKHPGKIKAVNKAIGSNTGTVDFYQSGGHKFENGVKVDSYYGSSSIRKPKLVTQGWKDMTFNKKQCSSITFDDYYLEQIGRGTVIDFIWADIQGAEVDLILGGPIAFSNTRYLYTEYCNAEYYEGEIGLNQICELLPDFEIVEDYTGDVLLKNTKLP